MHYLHHLQRLFFIVVVFKFLSMTKKKKHFHRFLPTLRIHFCFLCYKLMVEMLNSSYTRDYDVKKGLVQVRPT